MATYWTSIQLLTTTGSTTYPDKIDTNGNFSAGQWNISVGDTVNILISSQYGWSAFPRVNVSTNITSGNPSVWISCTFSSAGSWSINFTSSGEGLWFNGRVSGLVIDPSAVVHPTVGLFNDGNFNTVDAAETYLFSFPLSTVGSGGQLEYNKSTGTVAPTTGWTRFPSQVSGLDRGSSYYFWARRIATSPRRSSSPVTVPYRPNPSGITLRDPWGTTRDVVDLIIPAAGDNTTITYASIPSPTGYYTFGYSNVSNDYNEFTGGEPFDFSGERVTSPGATATLTVYGTRVTGTPGGSTTFYAYGARIGSAGGPGGPDNEGPAAWIRCTPSTRYFRIHRGRFTVSGGIVTSTTAPIGTTERLVYDTYLTYGCRQPDYGGFLFWWSTIYGGINTISGLQNGLIADGGCPTEVPPDTSISVSAPSTISSNATSFVVTVFGTSSPTSYEIRRVTTVVSSFTGAGTVSRTITNIPAQGTSVTYNIQARVTTANGGSGVWQDTGQNFTVYKDVPSFLNPDTSISVTGNFVIGSTSTSHSITIGNTDSSANASVTVYQVRSGASSYQSRTGHGSLTVFNAPVAGSFRTYDIWARVTTANGGTDTWVFTGTSYTIIRDASGSGVPGGSGGTYGLRVFDASGNIVVDVSDRVGRFLGTATTTILAGQSSRTVSVDSAAVSGFPLSTGFNSPYTNRDTMFSWVVGGGFLTVSRLDGASTSSSISCSLVLLGG